MAGLGFLKKITVDPSESKRPRAEGAGLKKERNPQLPFALRVFKDGRVYPSQGLVDRFALEYQKKAVVDGSATEKEAPVGNGFDVFSINDFPVLKGMEDVLILNVTPKSSPKVDLFGSTTYAEDKVTPVHSVLEQAPVSFGRKTLLGLIEAAYKIAPDSDGLDLVLLGQDGEAAQEPFTLPDGKTVCFVPKSVSRGEEKGKHTVAKRDNPELFILYPKILIQAAEESVSEEATDKVPE